MQAHSHGGGGRWVSSTPSPHQLEPGEVALKKLDHRTQMQFLSLKCAKIVCSTFATEPMHWGAYSTSPKTLAGLMGGLLSGPGVESNSHLEKPGYGPALLMKY